MPPSSISDNNDEACDSPQAAITEIQVVDAFTPNVSLDDVKVTVDTTKIPDSHPMVGARRESVSTTVGQMSDGASIHIPATAQLPDSSLPALELGPGLDPSTTRSPPSSPTSSTVLHDEPHIQWRARHRSTIEVSRIFPTLLSCVNSFPSLGPQIVSPVFSRISFTVETLPQTLANLLAMVLLVLKIQVLILKKFPDPLHHRLCVLQPRRHHPFLLQLSKSLGSLFQQSQPISALRISRLNLPAVPFSPLTTFFYAILRVSMYYH
jgi:hypothetical protein